MTCPTVTVPQAGAPGTSVEEAGLPARPGEPAGSNAAANSETTSGTITFTNGDGASTVTINGVTVAVNATVVGDYGTLTVTAFNAAAGTISYSYTLADNVDHDSDPSPFESFTVNVADSDGNPADDASATFQIQIVDDMPTANNDADSVTEDGPLTADGNVVTGSGGSDANATDGVADVQGADGANVSAVAFGATPGTVGTGLAGAYGTLTLNANGSYSYALNNANPTVQALSPGQTLIEVFTYTLLDSDGDSDTATLTITINGANDVPTVTVRADGCAGHVGGGGWSSGAAGRAGRLERGGELRDDQRHDHLHQWRRRLDGDDQRRDGCGECDGCGRLWHAHRHRLQCGGRDDQLQLHAGRQRRP